MLIGVGIGPGDPELLTVKAVKLLETAEAVFVPGEVARTVIAPYRSDAIGLTFPMTDDHAYIEECMQKNADRIAPVAREGLAVFAILGDPNFFGTFGRLKEIMMQRYPDIECSTVPGISAITAFASRSNVTISGGFSVSDGMPESARILLKIKKPKKLMDQLKKENFTRFILLERMFMNGEQIYLNEEIPENCPYFSILFAGK